MAGVRIVQTLSRTGGLGANVARRRLLETFQHIMQVTQSLAAAQPGGAGFAAASVTDANGAVGVQTGDGSVVITYADVPPVKGVIFTEGKSSTLKVGVDVTRLPD